MIRSPTRRIDHSQYGYQYNAGLKVARLAKRLYGNTSVMPTNFRSLKIAAAIPSSSWIYNMQK